MTCFRLITIFCICCIYHSFFFANREIFYLSSIDLYVMVLKNKYFQNYNTLSFNLQTVKYLHSVTKVKKVDSRNNKDFTTLKMLENCPKDFNSFTIRNMLLDADARVERLNNPSESAKTTQSRKKWWKNLSKHLKYWGNWVEENRGYIMVVATMITTLTFQQAASPLGGVWSQSGNVTFYTSHNFNVDAGTSVIGSIDLLYNFYFIIFNSIPFYCISHCHLLTNYTTIKNVYYNKKNCSITSKSLQWNLR